MSKCLKCGEEIEGNKCGCGIECTNCETVFPHGTKMYEYFCEECVECELAPLLNPSKEGNDLEKSLSKEQKELLYTATGKFMANGGVIE